MFSRLTNPKSSQLFNPVKKSLLLLSVLFLFCHRSHAQISLTGSKQTSYFTYIFKLNDNDILNFYLHPEMQLDDRILQHPIDSFRTGKNWKNTLPPGNYAMAHIEKNSLIYQVIENHSAFLQTLTNNYDLRFLITDKEGKPINNAMVTVKNSPVAFNAGSGTYRIKSLKRALVKVVYAGTTNYFQIEAGRNYQRKFLSGNWFRYQRGKIRTLFKKNRYYHDYKYRLRLDENDKYTGFMVFNKPIYKPQDTVMFKAYILDKKYRRPIDAGRLLVRLQENAAEYGTVIGCVNSYNAGGFEYKFVLADSLKLNLDNEYYLSLEDSGSVKYSEDKFDDADDEYKYLAQRKVYMAGKFRYEDYELKSVTFNLRTDKKVHEPGNPPSVYVKAADENGLSVPDGRVELALLTNSSSAYNADKIFIPDTLWHKKLALEPVGETKVTIPDSIFPRANLSYRVEADFLTTDNQSHHQTEYIDFHDNNYTIQRTLSGDTLKVTGLKKGKIVPFPATIFAVNKTGDTTSALKLNLPAAIVVNPFIRRYTIKADSVKQDIDISDFDSDLTVNGVQTIDSMFVNVSNPHKIHFWYWLMSGKKILEQGAADSLIYKRKSIDNGEPIFVLSYMWAGEPVYRATAIPYQDKLLNINIKQPLSVYPGQRVTTEIEVKDAFGKPAGNTDITAWSITSKFPDYKALFVPYLGKVYPAAIAKPQARLAGRALVGAVKLNWERWSREAGLDSIMYYRFTHPESVFMIQETAPDSVTQVAPFVVKQGDIQPVSILYIDSRPVYFAQARQLQRYSFKVAPGKHSFMFRTVDKNIRLDSIYIKKGVKLILSVNDTSVNTRAVFAKMPDTLMRYEADLINKYMISVADNFENKMATLEQEDDIMLLNPDPANYYNRNNEILAGPLRQNYAMFSLKNGISRYFLTEPGYSYLFDHDLLKQTSIRTKYPFSISTKAGNFIEDYSQYALTRREVEKIWQRYLDLRSHSMGVFRNDDIKLKNKGKLRIEFRQSVNKIPLIKSVIVYKDNDPDFMQIFPGITTDLGYLAAGRYRLFFLLENEAYYVKNNISIKPNGVNFYKIDISATPRDSVSIKINQVIDDRAVAGQNSNANSSANDSQKLKEAFNEKYFDVNNLNGVVEGLVLGQDDNLPLPGVSVIIRGTQIGIQTDDYGRFRLRVPASGTLRFSFVGYERREIAFEAGQQMTIYLKTNANELREVVVTGYNTMRKSDISGSVAGVTVTDNSGVTFIRGISTNGNAKPLIVVDGVIVKSLDDVDPNSIAGITALKDSAATAIYGSKALNGVIIVNTKKSNSKVQATDQSQQGNAETLRKNFSDYGYWQPKLTTDANGKASFTAVFPDDITNWRTFVAAVNGNRQSGFTNGNIKSFKPISANLVSPLFAVEGDELSLIGKVLNYTSDSVKLDRVFKYNDNLVKRGFIKLTNSRIDTLNITASNTDSLAFDYTIKRDNGYFDGERRKIPVIKQGVQETQGIFGALNGDTTLTMKFDPAKGPVTFRAEASVLPVLLAETERLRDYKYLCNEQLASKLKGLLMEKRIKKFLGDEFKYDRNINDLVKKLQENRKSAGTWGWWKDSDEELWISLHAVEALIDAQKAGYQIQVDKEKLINYLIYQLESYKGDDKLTCLELLHKLGAKVDYVKYFGVIEKENAAFMDKQLPGLSAYDKEKLMLLKQQRGIAINMDSLLAAQKHTMFGNIYWGDDSYSFFDNSIQLTVLAYQIIKKEGKHNNLLPKIQGYFLEQRRTGDWRNTYESALILETILPDVLVPGSQAKAPQLTIKGTITENVNQFPYTTTLKDDVVSVSKTGTLPVYITGYQQFWNSKPEKVSKDFTVNTWFEKGAERLTRLKGGVTIQLKAEVTAKGDADFVMIEIPIPAGCSYENKEQSWQNNEVHREYFKEKVSIFCRKLKQGKYEFTVKLIPRYSGKYTLNPAKAEMMYFPVFYGREGMKKVVIGE